MIRLIPLAVLLVACAGGPARADDGLIDGLPCNNLCRAWLEIGPPSTDARPTATERQVRSQADDEPTRVQRSRTGSASRYVPDPLRRRRPVVRLASRVEPARLNLPAEAPSRPDRASSHPALATIDGRGGYPSGIPTRDPDPRVLLPPHPSSSASASGATWEQTALRIFEQSDEPVLARAADAPSRHRGSRRRP